MKGAHGAWAWLLILAAAAGGCRKPVRPSREEIRSKSELECAIRYHRFNTLCRMADRDERSGFDQQAFTKYRQALDALDEIRKIDPFWNADAVGERALAVRDKTERLKEKITRRGLRRGEAFDRFLAARAGDPLAAGPWADLGDFFFNEHDFEEAIAHYREALQREPSNPAVLVRMGQVYSRVGNLEQARRIYARLIEANPDLAVAHYNLGGIYFRMKKPTYAIREYTRALEIEPRSVHTLNALGVACKQLKHYDEAEMRLKQAIRIDPGYAPAYYNLGLVFMERHNYPNATSYLQRAIDLFGPDSPRGRTIAELLRSRRRAP